MNPTDVSLADRVVLLTGVAGDIGTTYVQAFHRRRRQRCRR